MSLQKLIRKVTGRTSKCAAIIVAAGTASRMKGTDKIMVELCGTPVLLHTLRPFEACDEISQIIIVTREDLQEPISRLCVKNQITKVTKVVCGGATRAESVQCGLSCVDKKCDYVAIHDGARPLVTEKIIHDAVRKAAKYGAAAPAVAVKDTIKVAHGGFVEDTPDRSALYAVQTPQVFDLPVYRAALEKAIGEKQEITDDCSAAEAFGMKVCLTEGSDENIKLTTPTDLLIAEALLNGRKKV